MQSLKSNLKEKIAFLRLKSGDAEAFGFFYDQYVKQIYRFIMIKVSDRSLAEDMTQEVFLKTWQHLVDQRSLSNFRAFIFRIARNIVIDHYRKLNIQSLPLDYAEEVEEEIVVADQVESSLDAAALLKHLRLLKSEYQEALILRYVEEMSLDEIAEVLQKDKANVRVILHRAINKLKQVIKNNNLN